ncbi:MAG TPA: TOBE domain-containing protein, partial [Gemmataceae bacterium]|nr:TOBE domain-containing protein [Gemmataceae bacterium]
GDVFVAIRAEDVRLTNSPATPNDAENSVPAVVRGVTRERNLVRVRLDCGFALTALVPPHAATTMDLREGSPVIAVVAVNAVHVIGNG